MEEIKCGEYIRTKDGLLGEYCKYKGFDYIELKDETLGIDIEKDIKKHSFNIIDLIEVGDYVNGYKVINIDTGYIYVDRTKLGTNLLKTFTDYQIKSIVTREAMKSVEYTIE